MQTSKDFEELFALLNRHNVKYLVVGGYAYAIYAEPRYTKDLDLFYERSESNAARLLKCISEFGFGTLEITEIDLMKPGRVIQLGYPPLRIDFINEIDGVNFDECWKERLKTTYGTQTICVIGKKQLIKNKKASGRDQDLIDVKTLEKF